MRHGQSSQMRVLITGGTGFIGGRLSHSMIESGHQVFISGRKLVERAPWLPEAQICCIDWNDQDSLTDACKEVDLVIHAAGINALDCELNPIEALKFNGLATARLVQSSIIAGVNRFIYLSTAHVYDSQMTGLVTEISCPNNIHPYATSKLAGEKAVLWAGEKTDCQFIVLRLSNVFGAPLHKDVKCWGLLIPSLCRQVIEMGKIQLFSNAQSYRDFMSASSFCETVLKISQIDAIYLGSKVFNVGSGRVRSLLEIANAVRERSQKILGFLPEIEYEKSHDEGGSSYSFSTRNLNMIGIKNHDKNFEKEIDNLLFFCKAHYTK